MVWGRADLGQTWGRSRGRLGITRVYFRRVGHLPAKESADSALSMSGSVGAGAAGRFELKEGLLDRGRGRGGGYNLLLDDNQVGGVAIHSNT